MGTKLQLRAGDVEFTFESDESISISDAKDFISQVREVAVAFGSAKRSASLPNDKANGSETKRSAAEEDGEGQSDGFNLHVNSVAERIGAKSGSDVAMAAAAQLQLVEGKTSFSRKELLDTMKEATNFYSQTMRSNLSATLKGLIGTKLNQLKNDHYAIKSTELANLRVLLAD